MTDDLFFDTDCISSFLWTDDIGILHELYGGRMVLPEPVYNELSNPSIPHLKRRVDKMIDRKDVSVKEIVAGTKEYRSYTELVRGRKGQKAIGKGEASAIALTKSYNGILASNNYKDIAPYIKNYGLRHIDTGKILVEALKRKLITEAEGDRIWKRMLDKRRMLPTKTFSEYLKEQKRQGPKGAYEL